MKRILCIVLCALLLAGCQARDPVETTLPETATILAQAQVWDETGTLSDVPLSIPGLWKYTSSTEFAGGILLWHLDTHVADRSVLDLCLVELETGTVAKTAQVELVGYVSPQVLGDTLCLCDSRGGIVVQLDKDLEVIGRWNTAPNNDMWYLGGNAMLYQFNWDTGLTVLDLSTGESRPALDGEYRQESSGLIGQYLRLEVYDDGEPPTCYLLDLMDGTLTRQPFEGDFYGLYRSGGTWLCPLYRDSQVCYLMDEEGQTRRFSVENSNLRLLEEGYLLQTCYEGSYLRLYTLDGSFVSQCQISQDDTYYAILDSMIWSDALGGYFFRVQNNDGGNHLMFWDLSVETEGEDLPSGPIPDGSLDSLRSRADEMEDTYGVTILIGEECGTEFYDHIANHATDYEQVLSALDSLEAALASYPEGFFRQLRWDSVQGVQIQLIQDLQATDYRAGRLYSAFALDTADFALVVADVDRADTATFYHEFSHVIDSYLLWYVVWHYNTVYSGGGWEALNPEDFSYTYDYTADFSWFDYGYHGQYFIDSYAAISPTEDRARVMEYAMSEGCQWAFEGRPGLQTKLRFYCASIRDAFDTSGWPEVTQWEQYLYLAEE